MTDSKQEQGHYKIRVVDSSGKVVCDDDADCIILSHNKRDNPSDCMAFLALEGAAILLVYAIAAIIKSVDENLGRFTKPEQDRIVELIKYAVRSECTSIDISQINGLFKG